MEKHHMGSLAILSILIGSFINTPHSMEIGVIGAGLFGTLYIYFEELFCKKAE